MSYSLLDWVDFWQIFIPKRLELMKTHHCALACVGPDYRKVRKWARVSSNPWPFELGEGFVYCGQNLSGDRTIELFTVPTALMLEPAVFVCWIVLTFLLYVLGLKAYLKEKGRKNCLLILNRAVARSENPGGLVVMGGDNVPTLVEIGWIDLPKTGGAKAQQVFHFNFTSSFISTYILLKKMHFLFSTFLFLESWGHRIRRIISNSNFTILQSLQSIPDSFGFTSENY